MQELKNYLETFTPLSTAAWEAFQQLFYPQELAKNAFFARRGERATKIAFLKSGTIRAFYAND